MTTHPRDVALADRPLPVVRRATTAVVLAVAVAVALLAPACTASGFRPANPAPVAGPAAAGTTIGAGQGSTSPAPANRPYQVDHVQRTFTDPSRVTPAGAATPERPARSLVTEIYIPKDTGPSPLIVFAHGLAGHPDVFTKLLSRWAAAGYIVAAPAFPLTNSKVDGAPRNARDVWQQPGDIVFVLDQLLAANSTPGDVLADRIDPPRLGAAGLSLGGATTLGLAYNPCCRERRFVAFAVLAGNPIPLPQAYDFAESTPTLFVHGERDLSLSITAELDAFRRAKPPKWFVTLIGAPHASPFEDDVTPWDAYVEDLTTAFWDAHLARPSPGVSAASRFSAALTAAPDLARNE